MSTSISAVALSKRYRLSHRSEQTYGSLRESLSAWAGRTLGRLAGREPQLGARAGEEEFWALKNVNFEVEPGERLGIVGRNGAGKSTLLKILSRITDPTEGRIAIRGRVSSLLEVGTGFHPELTGRENIFLNGTILGMNSREIRKKFDQIVAFAEIERFLDTPVKRYSSGMYVRLAFGVAAHLEPDILIVDEVLAVGDAQFQRRCLGRMKELSGDGRTVIFVTHNMDALLTLCDRGLVLDRGTVSYDGSAEAARDHYMQTMSAMKYSTTSHSGRGGSGGATIRDVWLEDGTGNRIGSTTRARSIGVCMDIELDGNLVNRDDVDFAVGIDTEDGRRLHTILSSWSDRAVRATSSRTVIVCDFREMPLVPAKYLVSASVIFHGDTLDSIQHCTAFDVLPTPTAVHPDRGRDFGPLDLSCNFRERKFDASAEHGQRGGSLR